MSIYIGWDSREPLAYDVARNSILRRTKEKVDIQALRLTDPLLSSLLRRPIERKDGKMWCPISQAPMSTEFAISRFMVPILQQGGWAAFMDSDIVCLSDIAELFALADPKYALMCVQHKAEMKEGIKMDGQIQTVYSRKNWSSVMLFNCNHPANRELTLEKVNTWAGRDLHAFKWLEDRDIGELPPAWNYLVGVSPQLENPKLVHFTLGGPWFENWAGGPLDDIWLAEERALQTQINLKGYSGK